MLGVQDSVADRLESDVQVLSSEVGVDDFAPVAGKLLEFGNRGGELVKLGQAAIALLLDLGLDGLAEVLLQVDLLFKESVLVLLLSNTASSFKLGREALLVGVAQPLALRLVLVAPLALGLTHLRFETTDELLSSTVKLHVGVLDLSLSIVGSDLLQRGNLANDLLEVVLCAADCSAQLASLGAGVDGSDDVVDHLDELLDYRLGSLGDVDVVDRRNSGPSRLRRSRCLLGNCLLCAGRRILDRLLDLLGLLLHCSHRLRLGVSLCAVVTSLGAEIALIRGLSGKTAALADGHLVLSAHLRPVLALDRARRETLAELALFEVGHGILAARNVLGEEVVEVVALERVVDTTRVAQRRQNDEGQEEAAETAFGLGLDRSSRASGSGAMAGGRQATVARRRSAPCGSDGGRRGGRSGGRSNRRKLLCDGRIGLGGRGRSFGKARDGDVAGCGYWSLGLLGDGILGHTGDLVARRSGQDSLVRRSCIGECALRRASCQHRGALRRVCDVEVNVQ